jgi:hypothetical protein
MGIVKALESWNFTGPRTLSRASPARRLLGFRTGGILAVLVLASSPSWADSRSERPLQIQLELYGVSLGYHFSDLLYLGVTRQFGLTGNRFRGGHWMAGDGHDQDGHDMHGESGLYGQEGVTDDDLDSGDRTGVELRFSPEPFGVYLAIGALILEPDREQVTWDERSRTVGQGNYTTGLRADIESRRSAIPALGAGINHVFEGGLSLGAGFLYGVREPDPPQVEVTATNSDVSAADRERFRRKIRDDFYGPPLMFHLAAGYNF